LYGQQGHSEEPSRFDVIRSKTAFSFITVKQKKMSAKIINFIEEQINRGHTDANPVI